MQILAFCKGKEAVSVRDVQRSSIGRDLSSDAVKYAFQWLVDRGYGVWLGIVAALSVPVEFVTPQCWKKYYNLGPDKEASRAAALQLFPSQANELKLKKHHGRAEALLLAEFLRRKLSVKIA